jgi:hypothetical protein
MPGIRRCRRGSRHRPRTILDHSGLTARPLRLAASVLSRSSFLPLHRPATVPLGLSSTRSLWRSDLRRSTASAFCNSGA